MTTPEQARNIHRIAFQILPVVGAVVVFAVAVARSNTALYAVAAGMLGVPGVKEVTTNAVDKMEEQ